MPRLRSLFARTPRRRRPPEGVVGRSPCEALERRLMPSADVLTWHNDNARTGVNPAETILTPASVSLPTFGKVGQVRVDGQVYAQPLYKSGVRIPGRGVHDVVYVATEHDSVYAFDARSLALLWHTSFLNPAAGVTSVPTADIAANPLTLELGITGTPVIDPASSTLYVVARTKEVLGSSVQYVQRLHALDLGTGREKLGGPVVIQASVPGRGVGSRGGVLSFSPFWENQRTGLLLSNGVIYITWASWGGTGPYHGWVMAYNARNLQQLAAISMTPDGRAGGIWMDGAAPAADAQGNVYLASGNGTFSADRGGRDYGDTLLKLAPRTLQVLDYFTPFDQRRMDLLDLDFGSGGIMLPPRLPGAPLDLVVAANKEGKIYLANRNHLGGHSPTKDRVVQAISGTLNGVWATPAYFNGSIYYVGTNGGKAKPGNVLVAYHLGGGIVRSQTRGPNMFAYPGATPSISSNGTRNGIIWTLDNAEGSGTAILRAYDASNISRVLYDSSRAGRRDLPGQGVKFAVPTVANGRVYIGNNKALTVYGLFNPPPAVSGRVRGRAARR